MLQNLKQKDLDQDTQSDISCTSLESCAEPTAPCRPKQLNRRRAIAYCDGLIDILSAYFDVSGRAIRSPQRQSLAVARVRQIGMYVANVVLGINMTMIGHGFGRDKSTVTHACHLIEDLRDDEEFDQIVSRVEAITHAAFRMALAEETGEDI